MDKLRFLKGDVKFFELYENVLHDEISNSDKQTVEQIQRHVITDVNTLLEQAATQCQGLNFLANFVANLDNEHILKYFPYWMGKIIQILSNSHCNSKELVAACRAVGALFPVCRQIAELDKRISIIIIKQIVGIVGTNFSLNKNNSLLNLLAILLYHYPQSCARFQASLNVIITSCIDEKNSHLVVSGAKCHSLLVRAMERTFLQLSKNNPAIAFDNSNASCHIFYQISLCNILHTTLNELFQHLITTSSELPYDLKNTENMNILNLSKISCADLLEYYTSVENRFTNTCIYLSTLLKAGSIEGKKFALPNVIIQVICQGLSITPSNLSENDDENRKDLLLLILPKLHIGLLSVLEALIINFKQELLSFATVIQRLILQTLDWTQHRPQKSYKNIRMLGYKILSVWLKQTRSLSGFQLIADEFLPHISKDISPIKERVLLLSSKKEKSKKNVNSETSKTNGMDKSKIDNNNLCNNTDSILSVRVVLTVQSIISHANCFLKQSFYDSIRDRVVSILYENYVNKNSSAAVSKIDTDYRLQLLKALRILQLHPHRSSASPTSYAIQIFGMAISQESDPDIIEEASLALAELRHIVNPSAPSLMLPLSRSLNGSSDSEATSPKLSSLRDVVDFPSIDDNNDIINNTRSVALEQNKRPRLDDDHNGRIDSTIDDTAMVSVGNGTNENNI